MSELSWGCGVKMIFILCFMVVGRFRMRIIQLLILVMVVLLADARIINKRSKCGKLCRMNSCREQIKLKIWRTTRAQELNKRRAQRQELWARIYATSTAHVRAVLVSGKYVFAYVLNATTRSCHNAVIAVVGL